MKSALFAAAAALLCTARLFAAGEDQFYKLGPDSMEQEGVPHGKLVGPLTLKCEVYPGTQHTYFVYVPAQYDPAKPTPLMIYNDGQAMINMKGDVRVPNVFDNLIYRHEIPVLIGVFINPGRTPEQPEPTPSNWGDGTTNRGLEYNTLTDKYARVICDELLPAIKKDYNISDDPEQHAIAGASSGAIAAFTVAWNRPDQFRKVISVVGSFTNLAKDSEGGHTYPDLVLAADKKPIRVFLQDGRNDNRGQGRGPSNQKRDSQADSKSDNPVQGTGGSNEQKSGSPPDSKNEAASQRRGGYDQKRDWFYQNTRLADALTKKGYDVNYAWGIGLHGQKQGGAIMPDMLRWLWRDQPVSSDPNDKFERAFRAPAQAAEKTEPAAANP